MGLSRCLVERIRYIEQRERMVIWAMVLLIFSSNQSWVNSDSMFVAGIELALIAKRIIYSTGDVKRAMLVQSLSTRSFLSNALQNPPTLPSDTLRLEFGHCRTIKHLSHIPCALFGEQPFVLCRKYQQERQVLSAKRKTERLAPKVAGKSIING